MRFEWDGAKRKANRRKHGVEFADAVSVLDDPRAITIEDRDHGRATVRYARPGCLREAAGGGVRQVIRLISARKAEPHERRQYQG
jgi:hypothetical protein